MQNGNKKIKIGLFLMLTFMLFILPFKTLVRASGGEPLSSEFVLSDEMTRLGTNTTSNHKINFGTLLGLINLGDTITLTFQAGQFDLSDLNVGDIDLTGNVEQKALDNMAGENTWGVAFGTDTITFTAPTSGTGYVEPMTELTVEIGTNATFDSVQGVNQIINPTNPGSYLIDIAIQNTQLEEGQISIAIIDSDIVTITGSNSGYINFDIDTGTGSGLAPSVNCNYNTCLIHSGGVAGTNYTVDLGELKAADVNKSNTTAVMHSDGESGVINSIYFNLTSNAAGGTIVTVTSLNGGLKGPGEANMVNSVGVNGGADGDNILANSGRYGYTLQETPSADNGVINRNEVCITSSSYCGPTTTAKELFNTNGAQVEVARVRMDLAIAVSYTNTPGIYSDTLTFVATATF